MASVKNQELKEEYKALLAERPNFLLSRYKGLGVAELTQLRSELYGKNFQYRVIKNNIFKLALQDVYKENGIEGLPYDTTFVEPIGVVFAGEDISVAAKVLKDFGKDHEELQVFSAVMESTFYDEKAAQTIASLPTKDEMLATLAASLNGPATKIAGTMNNIMASLARAIQAVGEKNG